MDIVRERRLLTEIPGPRSRELQARELSAGVGVGLPASITRAAGGVLVDVDGNRPIDVGAGIAVTTVDNAEHLG